MDGSVLKIKYWDPLSTATSAMVLPLAYSVWKPWGPKSGSVMAKTVCAPCKAREREGRSWMEASTTWTLDWRSLAVSELRLRVMARIW